MLPELGEVIAETMPLLSSWNFSGSGKDYWYHSEHAVCVINFQGSRDADGFFINVGVQPLLIPNFLGETPDRNGMSEPSCVFRSRVDPPHGMAMWTYELESDEYDDVRDALTDKYVEYIVPLTTVPGPLNQITIDDFQKNELHPLFGGLGDIAICLYLGRLAIAYHRTAVARDFIDYGIANCSKRAAGLLEQLQAARSEIEG